MLKDILRIIIREGYISKTMLAAELKTSAEMVEDGIAQLVRMGYIVEEQTGEDCAVFCGSCPFAKTCGKEIVKAFAISDKGQGVLGR